MVAVATLCGYIPQIINLWNMQSDGRDLSLSTWGIWSVTSIITLLYSYYDIKDFQLCLTAGINLLCISIIMALTIYKRTRFAIINYD